MIMTILFSTKRRIYLGIKLLESKSVFSLREMLEVSISSCNRSTDCLGKLTTLTLSAEVLDGGPPVVSNHSITLVTIEYSATSRLQPKCSLSNVLIEPRMPFNFWISS